MRVMIHGPGPWTPGGYGVQISMLARHLRDAGHETGLSVFGGFVHEAPWEGMQVLTNGPDPYGAGLIAGNYKRFKADLVITVCDFFMLNPGALSGMTVLPWIPIDSEPLGEPDWQVLSRAAKVCDLHPVAMSRFGQAQLAAQDIEAPVIHHAARPEMTPGDRVAWRHENGVPERAFLIGMTGVNEGRPDRKAFDTLLCAFQVFEERHPGSLLYLHAVAQHQQGLDLYAIMKTLGLSKKIGFPDQYKRLADQHDAEYMAGMHRACDVTSAASRGEGFGVPIIESLACGTPVIGSRCTSMPELIPPEAGWLCDVQPQWSMLRESWWATPIVASLIRCMEKAHTGAGLMRGGAAREGAKYRAENVLPLWDKLLREL